MNAIQTTFMQLLEKNPDGLTLKQAYEKSGVVIKSGNVMALVKQGLVRKTENTNIYKLTKNVKPTETDKFRNTVADIENYYDSRAYGIYADLIK